MVASDFGFGSFDYSAIAEYLGISVTAVMGLLIVVSIWTIIWKGLALWKSARKNPYGMVCNSSCLKHCRNLRNPIYLLIFKDGF